MMERSSATYLDVEKDMILKQGCHNIKSSLIQKAHFGKGGLDCPHCPRTLERETALKRHISYEHNACPRPYICPFCKGWWPGKPELVAHMTADHPVHERAYPITCEFCLEEGLPGFTAKTDRQFRYHITRTHVKACLPSTRWLKPPTRSCVYVWNGC